MKKLLMILIMFSAISLYAQTTVNAVKQYTETINKTFEFIIKETSKLMLSNELNKLCITKLSTRTQALEDHIYLDKQKSKQEPIYPIKIGNWTYRSIAPEVILLFKIDSLSIKINELEKKMNILYNRYLQESLQTDGIRDTIWIDSEMDFYNGKVPVIKLRHWNK